MKKALILLTVTLFVTLLYFLWSTKIWNSDFDPGHLPPRDIITTPTTSLVPTLTIEKPLIIDHFACGDYCPGPEEQYMVKIYEGIANETECLKLGGKLFSYTGLGTTTVCLVK